jgi:hypothetical protein
MTIGAAGGPLPPQRLGGVALGTPYPFGVVDVFIEVVKVDAVLAGREAAIGGQGCAVAAVVVFGEEAAVFAAGVAFVVAALAPFGGDRVALTLSGGLMAGVTGQTLDTPLHPPLAAGAVEEMTLEAFAPQEVIHQIGWPGNDLFGEGEALQRDIAARDPPGAAGDVDGAAQGVVGASSTRFGGFGMATGALLPGGQHRNNHRKQ